MRNTTTIFLLALLVSIQTPVGELLRLPLLVHHFVKHQRKDDVSLFNFLTDHYTSHHDDHDKREDEQLPFKNETFYSIGYAIVPGIITANIIAFRATDIEEALSESQLLVQYLPSIFHPPR